MGESPIVVAVVNCGIVLGVPLPPSCAPPVETKNELSTSVPKTLRFMMRLRFPSKFRNNSSRTVEPNIRSDPGLPFRVECITRRLSRNPALDQAAFDPSSNGQVERMGASFTRAEGSTSPKSSVPLSTDVTRMARSIYGDCRRESHEQQRRRSPPVVFLHVADGGEKDAHPGVERIG